MGSAILIHTSAMPQDERGQALFNAFELLMHGMTEDLKFGQTDGVMMRSLVLTQYYYYGDSEFNPDDPEKQLIYCRNSECHVLSYLRKLKKMGLIYTRKIIRG